MLSKEKVEWSQDLECGIEIVDEQHKGLLTMLNELFSHSGGTTQEEHEFFRTVLERAVDYVKNHFSTEENIMKQVGFDGYEEHRKIHETFIALALEKAQVFQQDKKVSLVELTMFLKDWVLTHVAVMDKQCFSRIKADRLSAG
jgi:hemerythrin